MGLTQANLTTLPDFQEITKQLLRIIAGAKNLSCDPVIEVLGANPGFLSKALSLAAPIPADGTPYSRKIVYSSDLGDAMIAHWRGGASCLPHDHGDAHGIVTVLRGRFLEQAYELGHVFRAIGEEQAFAAGDFRTVVPGEIHSLRSAAEGVTLHLYAPPVRGMRIYDETSRSIYTVADDCGAWIPADPALIRERHSLGSNPLHD